MGGASSLSNTVFVGGWYSLTTKFSMTSGTSGVHISPPDLGTLPDETLAMLSGTVRTDNDLLQEGVRVTLTGTNDRGEAVSLETYTDTNGIYYFLDARPGTYTVTEYPPPPEEFFYYNGTTSTAGFINRDHTVGTANGVTIESVTLQFGDVRTQYNFVNDRAVVGVIPVAPPTTVPHATRPLTHDHRIKAVTGKM